MAVSGGLECGKGARKDRHIGTCNSSAKDIGESRQEQWVPNKGHKKTRLSRKGDNLVFLKGVVSSIINGRQ